MTSNGIAWMISGGRRFDDAWSRDVRHRAALAETRAPRRFGLGLIAAGLRPAPAPTRTPAAESYACCPA
jgi:hypothetical protein